MIIEILEASLLAQFRDHSCSSSKTICCKHLALFLGSGDVERRKFVRRHSIHNLASSLIFVQTELLLGLVPLEHSANLGKIVGAFGRFGLLQLLLHVLRSHGPRMGVIEVRS